MYRDTRETEGNVMDYFGINTFNDNVMREKLPKDVYKKLKETVQRGANLDEDVAATVAHAMKEWALENGVSHFTHWFQPMTGLTAEKHDAFLDIDGDGQPIQRFSGDKLIQGEPDASSFPSGGMRTTFEARGYTMWDPSSPAFIAEGPHGGILCIPSVFISYNGQALDKKTPLLRSMQALDKAARKLLAVYGRNVERVTTTLGPEQEYFLIDKNLYEERPDLILAGRTVIGAQPPKGQQMEDHYFGSIKERVLEFMQLAEEELYKLGIPAKTRHNEVAPHQFELAPVFGEANVAADRNQMVMEVLKKVAHRLDLALLLHEKPFAGINGSGKHVNWSVVDSEGVNLLDPGHTPQENLQFLLFLVSVIDGVHDYSDIIRASIASAGNDHRLGANEAPPAIVSVFLGKTLTSVLDAIESGKTDSATEKKIIDLGLTTMPRIMQDNTDRNRTSPFAFTGNKFEFRAVGSSASISTPTTILNAAVADALDRMADDIQKHMDSGKGLREACLETLQKKIKKARPVLFEGNNYSEEWVKEAEKRGLPNLKNSVEALQPFKAEKNIALMEKHGVFSKEELISRYNTKIERYINALFIECDSLNDIARTMVLPAAVSYQNELISSLRGLKEMSDMVGDGVIVEQGKMLAAVSSETAALYTALDDLQKLYTKIEGHEDETKMAFQVVEKLVPAMDDVRGHCDRLEEILPDSLWPLPKYRELLFVM